MTMKWNISENEPDLIGGAVILDGEGVEYVRRLDTGAGKVVRLHGDRGEQHPASECSLTKGGASDEPCEVLLSGEDVEVYNRDGERVA